MWLLAFALLLGVDVLQAMRTPASKCYAFDKDYHIYDFTPWIGHELEMSVEDSKSRTEDLVLRFCKDIQLRSSNGYVNYGRFVPALFVPGETTSFAQDYSLGDVSGCESNAYDSSGRTSHVSLVCGSCSGKSCKDKFGCICNATELYNAHNTSPKCSFSMVAAVKCPAKGPRVLKGFTVGFNPRGKEVVDDGIAQWGFERFHDDYSFSTEQRTVSLYLTAPAAFSKKVRKPSFTVSPGKGLSVKLSGSAANGEPPTTESPTVLTIAWQCDNPSGGPYSINVSVPVDGFDPIVFTMTKSCDHKQQYTKGGSSGWATFGVICLVFIILTSCCCCVGFCYNTRVEHKDGLEAVPGVAFLASYLNSARASDGYHPVQDAASSSSRVPSSKYGTV